MGLLQQGRRAHQIHGYEVICTFGEEPYTPAAHYPSAQAKPFPLSEKGLFAVPGVSFSTSRRTSGPVPGAAPTSHFPLLATAAPHTNGRLPSLGLRFRSRSHTPAQARKKGSSLLHSVADGRRVRLTARPDHAKKHPEFPYSEKRRIFAGDEALGKQQVCEDRTAALRVDAGGGTHAAPSPRRPDGRMSQLQPYQRGQSVPQRLHRHRFAQYATLCVVCVA